MISGRVANDGKEAIITVNVRGPTGRALQFEAVVDTGFNNDLSLHQQEIDDLKLPWIGKFQATLADGSSTPVDVYCGHAMWDRASRLVTVAAIDSKPLVGMGLMKNYRLTIEIIPGGPLLLEQIASS